MPAQEINDLALSLTQIAVRNTASAVSNRIQAWRARKDSTEVINELVDLVNELIAEKSQLVAVAQAFEQELTAQRISEDDITYITERLIPTLERLAIKSGQNNQQVSEMVDIVKDVVSTETLTILQLVGFNFKRALGEPLTRLVEQAISSRSTAVPSEELQMLRTRQEMELYKVARDAKAVKRLRRMISGN